jgi:hypothetical protein
MARRLWIGGSVQAPLYLTDADPRRPELVAWIDANSGKLLESEIVEPADSATSVARCLANAIRKSDEKPPDRVRVADRALAGAIRNVLGDRPSVEIAPTPELALVAESMAEFLRSRNVEPGDAEPDSYFENGRVSPETVAHFFESTAGLYRAAPWKSLWDADVIGLDVPQLGLSRAALSVIGRARQNYGFIIFDSASDYDAFGAAGQDPLRRRHGDIGAPILSLNFETKSKIPVTMRGEITRHHWPVAGPKAYPLVMAVDRDLVARPLGERELRIVSAAAECLTRFASKYRLSPEMPDTVSEEYTVALGEDLTVRLTAPHPEMPWLPDSDPIEPTERYRAEEDNARRTRGVPGVSPRWVPAPGEAPPSAKAPCPCGSGRAYRRCCMPR